MVGKIAGQVGTLGTLPAVERRQPLETTSPAIAVGRSSVVIETGDQVVCYEPRPRVGGQWERRVYNGDQSAVSDSDIVQVPSGPMQPGQTYDLFATVLGAPVLPTAAQKSGDVTLGVPLSFTSLLG